MPKRQHHLLWVSYSARSTLAHLQSVCTVVAWWIEGIAVLFSFWMTSQGSVTVYFPGNVFCCYFIVLCFFFVVAFIFCFIFLFLVLKQVFVSNVPEPFPLVVVCITVSKFKCGCSFSVLLKSITLHAKSILNKSLGQTPKTKIFTTQIPESRTALLLILSGPPFVKVLLVIITTIKCTRTNTALWYAFRKIRNCYLSAHDPSMGGMFYQFESTSFSPHHLSIHNVNSKLRLQFCSST